MKKILKYFLFFIIALLLFVFLANWSVEKNAKGKVFDSSTKIPKNKVGVVLGTTKLLSNGNVNLYYKYRLRAAIELFKKGKITHILVSGDNSTKAYDEPTDFKDDLIRAGIPESSIYLDYAGFRTLDSMVRAKEVFGQDEFTVISQKFHNERAVYLAEHFDIKAIAFNAKDVSGRYGLRVQLREYLARVKVFVDVLFNVQPKFLGKQIQIK